MAAKQYRDARDADRGGDRGLNYDLELSDTDKDLVDHYEDDEDYEFGTS